MIASTAASRLKRLVANAAARWRFSSTWRRSVRPIWKRRAGGIRRAWRRRERANGGEGAAQRDERGGDAGAFHRRVGGGCRLALALVHSSDGRGYSVALYAMRPAAAGSRECARGVKRRSSSCRAQFAAGGCRTPPPARNLRRWTRRSSTRPTSARSSARRSRTRPTCPRRRARAGRSQSCSSWRSRSRGSSGCTGCTGATSSRSSGCSTWRTSGGSGGCGRRCATRRLEAIAARPNTETAKWVNQLLRTAWPLYTTGRLDRREGLRYGGLEGVHEGVPRADAQLVPAAPSDQGRQARGHPREPLLVRPVRARQAARAAPLHERQDARALARDGPQRERAARAAQRPREDAAAGRRPLPRRRPRHLGFELELRLGTPLATFEVEVVFSQLRLEGTLRIELEWQRAYPWLGTVALAFLKVPTFDFDIKFPSPLGGQLDPRAVYPQIEDYLKAQLDDLLKYYIVGSNAWTLPLGEWYAVDDDVPSDAAAAAAARPPPRPPPRRSPPPPKPTSRRRRRGRRRRPPRRRRRWRRRRPMSPRAAALARTAERRRKRRCG